MLKHTDLDVAMVVVDNMSGASVDCKSSNEGEVYQSGSAGLQDDRRNSSCKTISDSSEYYSQREKMKILCRG